MKTDLNTKRQAMWLWLRNSIVGVAWVGLVSEPEGFLKLVHAGIEAVHLGLMRLHFLEPAIPGILVVLQLLGAFILYWKRRGE
jgi:hypothetical protein